MARFHPNVTVRRRQPLANCENQIPALHSDDTSNSTSLKMASNQTDENKTLKDIKPKLKKSKLTHKSYYKRSKSMKMDRKFAEIDENRQFTIKKSILQKNSLIDGAKDGGEKKSGELTIQRHLSKVSKENKLPTPKCDLKGNDLLFIEGTSTIFQYLRSRENDFLVKKGFLKKHPEISSVTRRELIEWLVEIHERINLSTESLFLSVNLLDRYMSTCSPISLTKLQMIGAACLFISSKLEDTAPVAANDLVYFSKKSFTKTDLYRTESDLAKELDFRLIVPYSLTFARRFLRVASASRFSRRYVEYLLVLAALDEDISTVSAPSLLAASAVFLTLRFSDPFLDHNWGKMLEPHSGYNRKELLPIVKRLLNLVNRKSSTKNAILTKFSRDIYGGVAKIPLKTLMQYRHVLIQKNK